LLNRSVSYGVITPAKYDADRSAQYPVIYLLHGLFGHFDNWTDKTKLAEYAAPYNFIIVTPEGGDGWYTDSATVPNDKYETYVIEELIPEVEKRFRTIADNNHRFIAGLSMGGYGAIKFGLKYPDKFSLVGSFSGALDAPLRLEDNKNLRPSIVSVFGPDDSKTRTDNDIFRLLRDAKPDAVKNIPYIYMACGTEDFLFKTNRDFDDLLIEKKVPHEYRELPGAHEWTFWDAQVQEFLRLADSKIHASRQ
jgi:S-formylglutathione hydrolase FrmB